jgi:membrane protease YdiL (CAAX protease family)
VLAGFLAIGAAAGQDADAGARAILAVLALASGFVCVRVCVGGLVVREDALIARGVFWSRRVPIGDVAGLAIEPVAGRRAAALAVVTREGAVVPAVLAAWRVRTHRLQNGVSRAARDVARAVGGHDVAALLTAAGRLDHPAAFTVAVDGGDLVAVPAASPDPGLTPVTVHPSGAQRLLGWETIFVVVAFVVPAAVSAVVVLVRDVAHVRALDEFELPLPHNPAGSLVLMLLLYGSTAVIVPIALLLLTRTGVPPRELGLTPHRLRLDLLPSVGLLGGVWLANIAVAIVLSPLVRHALTTSRSDTHVPAYFVVYALFLSAVTAVNEEVVVNGYLMTRLAQRGWRPWPSLSLSLALRTSYHAYYGVALLLTVPFGYLVTRSFQRTRRLGRPIITHFLYDAILLTVAVLTS